MIKIFTKYTDINLEQWEELVKKSETSSFFQTPECYSFYASLTFMKPFLFGVSENDKLVGVMCGYLISDGNFVKQYFSRRAIVPGGLLLDENISSEALQQLLRAAVKTLQKKAIYIEIRNYNDYSGFKRNFESEGFNYQAHLNFHVSTPDVDTALRQLSTTKRRDIKLSRKEGVEWYSTTDTVELRSYYLLLKDLYLTKIKTPLFPFEFFEKLVLQEQAKLFVVKFKEEIIGGSVCVILPEKTVYEWFVCGLDGKTKNIFPSTLATWAAIEFAATNDFQKFDMMGAGKPDEGYGVREFKSKFGGEQVENGRFLFICKPWLYTLGRYVIKKIKLKK